MVEKVTGRTQDRAFNLTRCGTTSNEGGTTFLCIIILQFPIGMMIIL